MRYWAIILCLGFSIAGCSGADNKNYTLPHITKIYKKDSQGRTHLEAKGIGHYRQVKVVTDASGKVIDYQIEKISQPGGTPTTLSEYTDQTSYGVNASISSEGKDINSGNLIRIGNEPYAGDTARIYADDASNNDQYLAIIQGKTSYFAVYANGISPGKLQFGTFYSGEETQNVPQSGKASYQGTAGGLMVMKNSPVYDQNGIHQVKGNASIDVDFSENTVSGKIEDIMLVDINNANAAGNRVDMDINLEAGRLEQARYSGNQLGITDSYTSQNIGNIQGEWSGVLTGENAVETAGSVSFEGNKLDGTEFTGTIGYQGGVK